MKIFAVCRQLTGGYPAEQDYIKNSGIQIGDEIELESARVYDWYTDIWLVGYDKPFNSVFFDFIREDGKEHDLYRDEDFWY